MNNDFRISFKLALIELIQGWRHFRVFLVSLILGVTIMAAVNTFGFIVEKSLTSDARSLLGGDIEVSVRGIEANESQLNFFKQYGDISYISTMRAMLQFQDEYTLVEIKAIDNAYPLIGEFLVNEDIKPQQALQNKGIIIDPMLRTKLGISLGDKVTIGQDEFIVNATIKNEPDNVVRIFSFGPRVFMSHDSLNNSQLAENFSLTEHQYRIITPTDFRYDEKIKKNIEQDLEKAFPDMPWEVKTGNYGNRGVQTILNQLVGFLTLSGLATFFIAGIGISSSIRSYLEKKSNSIAVLKVQGATKGMIFRSFLILITILSLIGGFVGLIFSSFITSSIIPILSNFLPVLKGETGIDLRSGLIAIWYGLLISYLFSMPAILNALKIKPSQLFRSRANILKLSLDKNIAFTIFLISLTLLLTIILNANDKIFIGIVLFVIILSFSLFAGLVYFIKFITRKIPSKTLWLKLAFRNMNREGSTTGTIVFAIGISLTVLISLKLVEENIQNRITAILEEDAPAIFMADIQPHQRDDIKNILYQYVSKEDVTLYPMLRGKVKAFNGNAINAEEIEPRYRWLVKGDRGVSYTNVKPGNAQLASGEWWPDNYKGKPLISVDERFLKGSDLKLGDTMTVNILGEDITAEIANSRRIDYSTFQINFSMIYPEGVIDNLPYTALATVKIENAEIEEKIVKQVIEKYPGITIIKVKEAVMLLREILANIAIALNISVFISLFAGLLVLISALSSTIEQRMYDTAMLKVLGLRKKELLKIYISEWVMIALITSIIAAIIGTVSAYLVNISFRAVEFFTMPHVTLTIIICCIFVICLIGYFGNKKVFNLKPANLLRN